MSYADKGCLIKSDTKGKCFTAGRRASGEIVTSSRKRRIMVPVCFRVWETGLNERGALYYERRLFSTHDFVHECMNGIIMDNRLKVVVMTQADRFFIPKNIDLAAAACELLEVVQVDCKSAMENKLNDYLKWFGFWQCAKMGAVTIGREAEKYLDRLLGYRLFHGCCSIKDVAAKNKVPYRVITNSNDPRYIQHIREMNPDLIISYSAPQIIKDELLAVPKHGVINVHGALLPNYRGLLPSFWYLYNDEKTGGATVHYMSAKIDDGDIIKQGSVDLSDCRSMFQVMKRTKTIGGELMVKAMEDIADGTVKRQKNETEKGSYFTWPTVEQAKEFRKKGKRLI